jgi:membrane protein DedA with SNARE-associated domain
VIAEYVGLFVLVAIMGAGLPGPGDAALIAAGTLAGRGELSLGLVLLVAGAAWMCGSVAGYWIGARGGRKLLDHPGRLEDTRRRTLSKGDRLFGRHNFVASMILPAFVSGIFHVRYRIFLAGVAVAGILWIGGYVLVAYFLGPDAVELLRKIGLKGIVGVSAIVAVGLALRWGWHRARLRRA